MAIPIWKVARAGGGVAPAGPEAAGTLGSLVSSVPVVVVIVGVVIVVVAALRGTDGPKPATPDLSTETAPGPPAAAADDVGPFEPAFPHAAVAEPEPWADISEPLRPTRLRSMALLTVTIVVLGSLAAGLLGGTVLLGARFLNRALG
jgi:hypothetical protein